MRIPKEIMKFIKLYQEKYPKFKTNIDVVVHALYGLMREESLKENGKKDKNNIIEPVDQSPMEKYLRKVELDFSFRKNEYEITQKLTHEQQRDYLDNYQPLGMSVQDYYKVYIKGEK